MKNEPEDYSIDNLKKDKIEPWDGIRNYQVRNMIRDDMSIGDIAFFYHSNCEVPGIYGLMTINSQPYPDHTAFDKKAKYYDSKSIKEKPRWLMVDVKYKRKMKNPITLKELKSNLISKDPIFQEIFKDDSEKCFLNLSEVDDNDRILKNGDVLAFLPPVNGG